MVVISGFAIFTYIIILGAVIATVFLEAIFVKRKQKKAALTLICIIFIFMTISSVYLATFNNSVTITGVTIWSNSNHTEPIGDLQVISDDNNIVLGFGMLKVTTGDSPKYLKLEYNDKGDLIGENDAMQYSSALHTSLKDANFEKLQGTSMNVDQIEKAAEKEMIGFDIKVLVRLFLINNMWTAILIAVYMIFTHRNNKLKMNSINHVKIQDL